MNYCSSCCSLLSQALAPAPSQSIPLPSTTTTTTTTATTTTTSCHYHDDDDYYYEYCYDYNCDYDYVVLLQLRRLRLRLPRRRGLLLLRAVPIMRGNIAGAHPAAPILTLPRNHKSTSGEAAEILLQTMCLLQNSELSCHGHINNKYVHIRIYVRFVNVCIHIWNVISNGNSCD